MGHIKKTAYCHLTAPKCIYLSDLPFQNGSQLMRTVFYVFIYSFKNAHWKALPFSTNLFKKEVFMTVTWCGSLAFLLNQLRKSLFRTEIIPFKYNDKIKRIGVYYMCLDDLLL